MGSKIVIEQPFPRSAPSGIECGRFIDAPRPGEFNNTFTGSIRTAKLTNLIFRQLHAKVLRSAIVGFVLHFVGRISRASSPTHMPMIDAPTNAAFMRCVAKVRWTLSMFPFADQPMHAMLNAFDPDTCIASIVDRKRPQNTFVGFRTQGGLDKFFRSKVLAICHFAKDTHSSQIVN